MESHWDSYWEEKSNRSYWLEPDRAVVELKNSLDKSGIKDVLDLGCGIGRHTLLFAEAGFKITAVDSSQNALNLLQRQVEEKGIPVKIINGNYSQDLFPGESFDFILAYNVLYHGYRETFTDAIHLVYRWLKPGGLFFFTCPTRRDDKYGNGEEVAEDTYKSLNSAHLGDVHYFAGEYDIADFLSEFSDFSKSVYEHYWDNKGTEQFSSHWLILAHK